jgi:hypothetical protein
MTKAKPLVKGFFVNTPKDLILPVSSEQAYAVVSALLANYITGADKHMSRMLVSEWFHGKLTMEQAITKCDTMIASIKPTAKWGSKRGGNNGQQDISAHMRTMFAWYGIPIKKVGEYYTCDDNTIREYYGVATKK